MKRRNFISTLFALQVVPGLLSGNMPNFITGTSDNPTPMTYDISDEYFDILTKQMAIDIDNKIMGWIRRN